MEATLDKVRAQSGNALPHIQRPALLLQAIDGTLKDSGTASLPTAYFASLAATLSSVLGSDPPDGQLVAASLYLLAIVVPHTPDNVLIHQHDQLLHLLSASLALSTAEQASLKSLLTVLSHLLTAFPAKVLNKLGCTSLYNSVLPLCADGRPKLRKKAHDTVKVVFNTEQHPYQERTAEWTSLALEAGYKDAKRNEEAASKLIGLLTLVSQVVTSWPKQHLDDLLTQLLAIPKINNAFLARSAFDVLEALFTRAAHHQLPVPATFESLLALRPANNAVHTLPSWLAALEHAFVALNMVDAAACAQAFPASFQDALELCGSQHPPPVRAAAEKTAKAMIRWCLPVDQAALVAAIAGKGNLVLVVEALDEALSSLKFTGAGILHILHLSTQLIHTLRTRPQGEDQTAAELFLDSHLIKIGQVRANPGFEYRDAAEHAIAAMARVAGPAHVLRTLPLNLFGEEGGPSAGGRAWLLPLLRGNITNTNLTHFTQHFLPLSESLFTKSVEAGGVEKKIYDALIDQIWALFPGYCDLPIDLQEGLTDGFAQVLGSVMYSQASLRPALFRGLLVLVESNEKLARSTAPPESNKEAFRIDQQSAKSNLDFLGKKGVNLLSVMFNVYLKSSEGSGYMLDTVAAWMRVLAPKDLAAVHGKIVGMLNQALSSEAKAKSTKAKPANAGQTSHALLDLLVCLSSSSNAATAQSLLDFARSPQLIENQDSTVQKKAYRLLLRLADAPAGRGILASKVGDLVSDLGEKTVSGPAKKDRTELLSKLVEILPNNHLHVIPPILSEAVLATKESNERTRLAGFELIVEMGNKMRAGGSLNRALIPGMDEAMDTEETPATLTEYFTMVAAGLTSSPHMISASLTALSRLMFDFHQDLDRMTVDELLSTVTVFLKSNTREIVKSSMGFVKVCIAVLSHQTIEAYLPSLVPSLCGWGTEHKNHFNLKVRHIFERLIRKFGYENVEQYVPEDDKKLVQNIRKKQLRAKRRKGDQPDAGEGDDNIEQEEMAKPRAGMKSAYDEAVYGSESEMGDSSDDDDDHKPAAKGKQQQQKKGKKDRNGTAFLQEGGDMPMDLLDQDQLDKVTVKNPRKGGKQQKGPQVEFEKDASGRMVINEDGDEDGEGGGESTNAYLEAIAGEDGFHRTTKGGLKSNKGRKRSRQEEDDDRWVDEIEGKMRLDDGESSGKKKKAKKQQIGSEFKAKKAGGDVKKDGVSPYAYVPLGQVAGKGKNKKNDLSITGKKGRGRAS